MHYMQICAYMLYSLFSSSPPSAWIYQPHPLHGESLSGYSIYEYIYMFIYTCWYLSLFVDMLYI